MEAVLPIEVETHSLRVLMETKLEEVEDLVLKKILPIYKIHKGKWTLNHEGSYVVKKTFFIRSFNPYKHGQ
ncbi:hypothetical protein CR513_20915, partial [Mucuna pruriens]